MDCAICLCHCPLPTTPQRLSSGAIGAATPRASRVHLSLSHGSLSVSHCSKQSHLVSRPLHVNCMLGRFSEGSKNEENGKNPARGMGGVSLVLACVLGAFTFSSKMNPKPNVAYAGRCSAQAAAIAVKQKERERCIFDSFWQLIKKDVRLYGSTRKDYFDNEPSLDDVEALKLYAMAISNSGHPIEAESILRDECRRWEGSMSSDILTMALIELLLDQGNYQEASIQLDKLIEDKVGKDMKDEDPQKKLRREIEELLHSGPVAPLTVKICLNKAIVDSILNKKEAATWWETFRTARNLSPCISQPN